MRNEQITNKNLREFDGAQRYRAAALRVMHSSRVEARTVAASSGWGTDVAGSDRRSVRAYLDGKRSVRQLWWSVFSWGYLKLFRGATLERAMYAFHRMHHGLTILNLQFAVDVAETAAVIQHDGILAAARHAAMSGSVKR